MRYKLLLINLFFISASLYPFQYALAEKIVANDGHVHYDEDVWSSLSPKQAVEVLKDENIQRALVSATPGEGTEMMYREDPVFVIPMLRPYESWRHRYFWFKDKNLISYLKQHLQRVPYRGFGEFHIFGRDVLHKPVNDMIELARERQLSLHPHIDLAGMKLLLEKASDLVVIWAHAGFNEPVSELKPLLDQYPNLYLELSLRDKMTEDGVTLTAEWKQFLIDYQTRFMIGTDTYKPARWADVPETMEDFRSWLVQLPADVAKNIAAENINRLFPVKTNNTLQ